MDNLTQLLKLAGQLHEMPPIERVPNKLFVVDGFVVDLDTGDVHGQYICVDTCSYTNQPLFIYNRSVRFEELVWKSQVPGPFIPRVLQVFSVLEQVWEKHKSSFERKYFLTQRLLLQEICRLLGCSCSIVGRPIRDKRRYKKQIEILKRLLHIFVEDKKLRCQLPSPMANKLNSITSSLQPKCLSQDG